MHESLESIRKTIYEGGSGWWFEDVEVLDDPSLKSYSVQGKCHFNIKFESELILDNYDLKIQFPYSYPKELPRVWETGGRIPNHDEYHNSADTGMCLATPAELRRYIYQDGSLKFFIQDFVVQFLYAYSYRLKHKVYPWPTQAHNYNGILDDFRELFYLQDNCQTELFLRTIYKHNRKALKKHKYCPCKSGKRFWQCHKRHYDDMCKYYKHKDFVRDLERNYRLIDYLLRTQSQFLPITSKVLFK